MSPVNVMFLSPHFRLPEIWGWLILCSAVWLVSQIDRLLIHAQEVGWGLFGLSVSEIRERLRADVVAAHAEIFLINGDINSNLYTSTRAMHSSIIGLLQVCLLPGD